MSEKKGGESFWDDDTETGSRSDLSRASLSNQGEAVHIGVQQGGVFAKAENGTDDTFSYINRKGFKLRTPQRSAASLDTLEESADGQACVKKPIRADLDLCGPTLV